MLGMPTDVDAGQDMSSMADGQIALAAPMMGIPQQQVVYTPTFPQGAIMMPFMGSQGAMMMPGGYTGMPMMMMPGAYAGAMPGGTLATPMLPAGGYVMPGVTAGYMMAPDEGTMPVLPQEIPQAPTQQQSTGALMTSANHSAVSKPIKGPSSSGFGGGNDRGLHSGAGRGSNKSSSFNNDRGGTGRGGGRGGNRFSHNGNHSNVHGSNGAGRNGFNNAGHHSHQISSNNKFEMPPKAFTSDAGKSGIGIDAAKVLEDSDAVDSAKCHLFLGGLASSASNSFVRELFNSEGLEIETLKIPVDRATGHPKGYAFVNLADPSLIPNAIKSLSGRNIGGRELIVQESSGGSKGKNKGKSKGLEFTWDNQNSMDKNSRAGGKNAGGKGQWGKNQLQWGGWPLSGGWGKGGAANGSKSGNGWGGGRGKLQGWDPAEFGGIYAPIALEWAAQQLWGADGFFGRSGGKGFNLPGKYASRVVDPNKLFVGNLAPEASEEDIRRELGTAGDVVSVRILDGKLAGCGFVEFRESKSVTEAIGKLQGVDICGRPVRLERQGGGRGGLSRQTPSQRGHSSVQSTSVNGDEPEEAVDDAAEIQNDMPGVEATEH